MGLVPGKAIKVLASLVHFSQVPLAQASLLHPRRSPAPSDGEDGYGEDADEPSINCRRRGRPRPSGVAAALWRKQRVRNGQSPAPQRRRADGCARRHPLRRRGPHRATTMPTAPSTGAAEANETKSRSPVYAVMAH